MISRFSSASSVKANSCWNLAASVVAGGKDGPLHARLTGRELEVLCLLASGKTVSDVAKKLALSVKTVSTHRTRILAKMNMKTNAELTHYAIKNKLVE